MSGHERIRLARPDDAEALGTIEATSYLATYRGIMPDSVLARVSPERMIERLRPRLDAAAAGPPDERHRMWVILDDAGVVRGYATTEPATDQFLRPPDGAGELESLYLDPGAIGQGYGRALLAHAVQDLVAHGFDPLILWAFEQNGSGPPVLRAGRLDPGCHRGALGPGRRPLPIVRYRLDKDGRPA